MSALREKFGERLRDLRFEKRMTQDEFAEFLGISPDSVSSMERGINAPSFETLDVLSAKLKRPVSELFDFSDEPGTRKRLKKPRKRNR